MTITLLNVDDTEIARYAKRRTLEHAGFTVVDAVNGREALDQMAEIRAPLVLLDVHLPDLSGIDVCQIIKERWPGTMVLQTSATFITSADRTRGLQGGADGYLIQPIDADELIASVRALLRLHAAEESSRQLNATLEERIEMRTRELRESNIRLIEQIAQRERAEAALVQSQKMEVVGQLTGAMVHDFNNILASMNGYIHLVRRLSDRPEHQALLDKALAAADRGKRLTSRLLAFSRSDELVTGPVDVGNLLTGMQEWLKHSVGSTVSLALDVDPGTLVTTTDATQLELAVLNLVINARDAIPIGGEVRIRVRPESLDEPGRHLPPGDYVVISVRDSGNGMPPEVAERAFDPFFTTKPAGRGTGLGLAQVQTVARLSGGTATISSTEGVGTEVEIWLAGRAGESGEGGGPADAPMPPGAEKGQGQMLLVVDDEADIRRTLADLLRGQGYRVITAASGEEGLTLLQEESPALLVLDFSMPGMSGLEVARQARRQQPDLPVLFVTAFADRALISSQLTEYQVLSKPFSAEALYVAVAAALL